MSARNLPAGQDAAAPPPPMTLMARMAAREGDLGETLVAQGKIDETGLQRGRRMFAKLEIISFDFSSIQWRLTNTASINIICPLLA